MSTECHTLVHTVCVQVHAQHLHSVLISYKYMEGNFTLNGETWREGNILVKHKKYQVMIFRFYFGFWLSLWILDLTPDMDLGSDLDSDSYHYA